MAAGKWVEGLTADTPVAEAARLVTGVRLRAVARALHAEAEGAPAPHPIRVATRRAAAALRAFASCLPRGERQRAERRLGRIRRAAAMAREAEVHGAMFRAQAADCGPDVRRVLEYVGKRLEEDSLESARHIEKAAARYTRRRLRRGARRVAESVRMGRACGDRLTDVASREVGRMVERARRAADEDLSAPDNLHGLRLRLKRLRYALEVFAPCFGPLVRDELYPRLVAVQDTLGAVNDIHQVIARLEREQNGLGSSAEAWLVEGIADLRRQYEEARDQRHREALEALEGVDGLLRDLVAAAAGGGPVATGAPSWPVGAPAAVNGALAPAVRPEPPPTGPCRLAAIDAGTNSIRLMVAEVHPDGSYRVLDDEKEITRLGRGLDATGAMHEETMERTIVAIERMKRIATGYGVKSLRLIGTSACREASNREVFFSAVLARTGLRLEVISAHEEARLAYLSAAHSFDLRGTTAAVIDIGGGSTEIVLSAGGVTEEVYSLPLGAVRLTEKFGGPERCAGDRFKKMRSHIRAVLREGVGRPALAPQIAIGTGGTFTTLANILAHQEFGAPGPSLWDRGVLAGGPEATRSDMRHVLDRLRHLPLRDRARVPGVPVERADIIVAGLAIAERVMKLLGVNAVRVNDRGIRDGLIITMAQEIFPPAGRAGSSGGGEPGLRAVRRFAESCRYEAAHSEHVTRLALSIHAQLGEALGWAGPERASARRLLEAAGVLHDAGYLVNYTRHHKHSYHLIVHSDLAGGGSGGFTRREIEVIANVARYHRQAEPKKRHPNYGALAPEDRRLVRRLSAILRVADGLDRTHTQNARAVAVTIEGGAARFAVDAPEDPATDLWGAARKSELFRRVFGLEPRFEWARAQTEARPEAARVA